MDFNVFYNFLHSQFLVTPSYPKQDCTGKTICVTGSNTGLGKEAVRHFVRLGAEKVIIACRSAEKGEAAKKDIEASEGRTGVIEVWSLDLCDYESVKAFAVRLNGLKRLDSLVENAGKSYFPFPRYLDFSNTLYLAFSFSLLTHHSIKEKPVQKETTLQPPQRVIYLT